LLVTNPYAFLYVALNPLRGIETTPSYFPQVEEVIGRVQKTRARRSSPTSDVSPAQACWRLPPMSGRRLGRSRYKG
jgi:hypothetical protein